MAEENESKSKKKKKKGKGKLLLILIPVVLLLVGGGTVVGLALTGKIFIPGLSKAKPKAKPKGNQKVAVQSKTPPATPRTPFKPKAKEDKTPVVTTVVTAKVDPNVGREKLAEIWNEMEVAKLKSITSGWKDEDLAPVLNVMMPDKVTELLSTLDTKRASSLSKKIQEIASVVPL